MSMGLAISASYVTVMYSLSYGYARSVAWTVSFLSTFFQDAGIFEPMKVLVIAAFMTFVANTHARPKVPDSQTLSIGRLTKYVFIKCNKDVSYNHYLICTPSLPLPIAI